MKYVNDPCKRCLAGWKVMETTNGPLCEDCRRKDARELAKPTQLLEAVEPSK